MAHRFLFPLNRSKEPVVNLILLGIVVRYSIDRYIYKCIWHYLLRAPTRRFRDILKCSSRLQIESTKTTISRIRAKLTIKCTEISNKASFQEILCSELQKYPENQPQSAVLLIILSVCYKHVRRAYKWFGFRSRAPLYFTFSVRTSETVKLITYGT